MIELNLLVGKKPFRLPVIIGIDFNLINYRFLIVFIILHSILLPISKSHFEGKIDLKEQEIKKSLDLLANLTKKENEMLSFSGIAEELSTKEIQLKQKLELIKNILQLKKNPFQMFLFVAKNIPNDIWLNQIVFEKNIVSIKGYSRSYRSIGLFIDSLKKSIFFENAVRLENSKTITTNETGNRTEEFLIIANVVRFK